MNGPTHLACDPHKSRPSNLLKELVERSLLNLHICVTSHSEIDIRTALESLTFPKASLQPKWTKKGYYRLYYLCHSDLSVRAAHRTRHPTTPDIRSARSVADSSAAGRPPHNRRGGIHVHAGQDRARRRADAPQEARKV